MVPKNILLWAEGIGFYEITEGTGDNLFVEEDEINGFVDYIMITNYESTDSGFKETDGAQAMLSTLYQEKFHDEYEVVDYLIESGWIPNADYIHLEHLLDKYDIRIQNGYYTVSDLEREIKANNVDIDGYTLDEQAKEYVKYVEDSADGTVCLYKLDKYSNLMYYELSNAAGGIPIVEVYTNGNAYRIDPFDFPNYAYVFTKKSNIFWYCGENGDDSHIHMIDSKESGYDVKVVAKKSAATLSLDEQLIKFIYQLEGEDKVGLPF